jgi:hypothetical protein
MVKAKKISKAKAIVTDTIQVKKTIVPAITGIKTATPVKTVPVKVQANNWIKKYPVDGYPVLFGASKQIKGVTYALIIAALGKSAIKSNTALNYLYNLGQQARIHGADSNTTTKDFSSNANFCYIRDASAGLAALTSGTVNRHSVWVGTSISKMALNPAILIQAIGLYSAIDGADVTATIKAVKAYCAATGKVKATAVFATMAAGM